MSIEKVALVTAGGSGMGARAALADHLGGFGVTGSNQSLEDRSRLVDGARERWGRIDGGLTRGV